MGGFGSMRWGLHRTRATTDSLLWLDVRLLARRGALTPGTWSATSWTCNGEPSGHIDHRAEADALMLDYRTKAPADAEWQPVRERIPLDATPYHYGGSRPWFLCPGCGRRRAAGAVERAAQSTPATTRPPSRSTGRRAGRGAGAAAMRSRFASRIRAGSGTIRRHMPRAGPETARHAILCPPRRTYRRPRGATGGPSAGDRGGGRAVAQLPRRRLPGRPRHPPRHGAPSSWAGARAAGWPAASCSP